MIEIDDVVLVTSGRNTWERGVVIRINSSKALVDFGRNITLYQSDGTSMEFPDAYWVSFEFLDKD